MVDLGMQTTAGRLSDYSDATRYLTPRGTFVSLYAGAGGLDIGFALAGFAPVWVSELDKAAMQTHDAVFETLKADLPHLRGSSHDSHTGDLLALREDQLPGLDAADLVIGGPPCQGFSVAGKMDPTDERSKHVFHFMDIVDRIRPKAFLLENVKALYENQRWAGIRDGLKARAEELGYNTELTLVNASHFGVPQARERMFFIGVDKRFGNAMKPTPTTAENPPTVRDALAQLPPYGQPGNDSFCVARITTAKAPVLRRSRYAGMLFNGAGRPLNLDAPSITLAASMGGNKTPIIEQQLLDGSDMHSWVESYHRQLMQSNGTNVSTDVPQTLRRLTVEEAAALQTFPIGMKWSGPQSSRFRQIGNAVPPRLGMAAAETLATSLGI